MADQEDEDKGGGILGGLSGLGKGLKGMLFEESADDESTREKPATKPAATRGAPSGAASPAPPRPAVSAVVGTADPQIRAVLQKPVDEAAKPAYSAFLVTMANLKLVIPDEATRIKAAIATLPQGATLTQLIVDIDECLAAIAQRENEATQSAQRKRTEQVGKLEQELQGAVGGIAQKRGQITSLEREIAQLEATKSRVQNEIATAGGGIDQTLGAIAATAAEMRNELTDIRAKIKQQQQGG